MSFWSKFGKVASFAAPLIAAPFTGGLSLAALAGKIAPQAIGALANKGQPQVSTPPYVGNGSAGSTGSQLANIIPQVANIYGQHETAAGAANTAYANSLASNRGVTARNMPGATTADHQAFANMMRASNIANYKPNAHAQELFAKYGQHDLTPTAPAMDFSRAMQDQLNQRIHNGQPLTLSAMEQMSPEEAAAGASARRQQSTAGGIDTGTKLAQLGMGALQQYQQAQAQKPKMLPAVDDSEYYAQQQQPQLDNTYGDF